MNFNAIIAVLILRGVITEDEGNQLVEHLNDKPQSTVLRDSIAQIAEIIGKPQNAAILPQLGPVGPAQHAEEMAARANPPAATPPVAPAEVPNEPANHQPQTAEPELAANEAKVDEDQAANKPSDSASADKSATDDNAKSTSVKKSTDTTKKK